MAGATPLPQCGAPQAAAAVPSEHVSARASSVLPNLLLTHSWGNPGHRDVPPGGRAARSLLTTLAIDYQPQRFQI